MPFKDVFKDPGFTSEKDGEGQKDRLARLEERLRAERAVYEGADSRYTPEVMRKLAAATAELVLEGARPEIQPAGMAEDEGLWFVQSRLTGTRPDLEPHEQYRYAGFALNRAGLILAYSGLKMPTEKTLYRRASDKDLMVADLMNAPYLLEKNIDIPDPLAHQCDRWQKDLMAMAGRTVYPE